MNIQPEFTPSELTEEDYGRIIKIPSGISPDDLICSLQEFHKPERYPFFEIEFLQTGINEIEVFLRKKGETWRQL